MRARKADKETKLLVREWLGMRGLEQRWADYLPENGMVVFDDEDTPVAIGFIRQVEGNYGLIGEYVTNPFKTSYIRDQALDVLTINLITMAKDLGLQVLIGYSKEVFTLMRSERYGFKRMPETLIRLDLSGVGE